MSLPEVQFISNSTILPSSSPTNPQTWELTPWDLALLPLHYIQKGLLFPKPTCPETTINLLKTSLSHTLNHFTPLAGRMTTTKHNNKAPPSMSFFIQYSNNTDAGAHFIQASSNITMAEILEPLFVPSVVHSLFHLNLAFNYNGLSQPLLAVQVTELTDGIFIGCSINHVVADGASFWHFFNTWSEISRGIESISRCPVLSRWYPNGNNNKDDDPSFPIPLSSHPDEFIDNYSPSCLLHERIFHFSASNIANLKAKANMEQEKTNNRVSSLQALLAHIWRGITRARNLPFDQETSLRLPLNNRARLNPPLPENYFGNSIQVKAAKARADELVECSVGWAARLLNEVVVSHTDDEVRSYMQSWLKSPRLSRMSRHRCCDIVVMSSPRFSVYGNDFGWCRPVAVRSGVGNKCDGNVTLYEGIEGSVEVEICLPQQTLRALGDDLEFMEMVTI